MKMNNQSARLIMNAWLDQNGHEPISADMSYEEYATELRKITGKTLIKVPFVSRADAVAYIREMASQHRAEIGL